MPSRGKVPLTFTFHRRGVHPPLFVAGSFSNPQWQLFEMNASIDQHGDFIFTKQVFVDECSEIQYKFRHASGDWWALDPDADTVTDDQGNVNSLLYSPTIKATQEITLLQEIHVTKSGNTAASHAPDDPEPSVLNADTQNTDTDTTDPDTPKGAAEKDELRRLASTPIEEVANTAAEVADSPSQLDDDELEVNSGDILPMFSHECFASPSSYREPELQLDSIDHSSESADLFNMNFDDPRLEHFPSDRDSIIATMRRLSATLEADPTMVDAAVLSPIITAKSSIASIPSQPHGFFIIDDTSNTHERTENTSRYSASIAPRNSLQSIAEGDENESRDRSTLAQYTGPIEKRNLSLVSSSSSDEDEGVSMSTTPRKHISKETPIEATDNKAHPISIIDEATANDTYLTEERSVAEERSVVSSSSKSSERNDGSSLKRSINGERPHSPSSTYSIYDNKKCSWLGTFFRTVFVDWIGDLFCWLCSRGRNQV
ncbi:hypothetical protein F5X98DRAFT_362059 [Xylaria grammica]|nr:hypothetical protein F5X98DRAFT_362059 [Xylaria grammica]